MFFEVPDCHVVLSNVTSENATSSILDSAPYHSAYCLLCCSCCTYCHSLNLSGFVLLDQEITAELGSMSESSDDEYVTTRIVRRRVVIQGDEMPDLPTQSVTEEKYRDENGHMVVKKVKQDSLQSQGLSCCGGIGDRYKIMTHGHMREVESLNI
uniref:Ankyrin 1, erythrocytic a n=1 Tax=Acanthochromis polyacanthus TaxID=80966 RepID=A0A3Q1EYA8_9TELE